MFLCLPSIPWLYLFPSLVPTIPRRCLIWICATIRQGTSFFPNSCYFLSRPPIERTQSLRYPINNRLCTVSQEDLYYHVAIYALLFQDRHFSFGRRLTSGPSFAPLRLPKFLLDAIIIARPQFSLLFFTRKSMLAEGITERCASLWKCPLFFPVKSTRTASFPPFCPFSSPRHYYGRVSPFPSIRIAKSALTLFRRILLHSLPSRHSYRCSS